MWRKTLRVWSNVGKLLMWQSPFLPREKSAQSTWWVIAWRIASSSVPARSTSGDISTFNLRGLKRASFHLIGGRYVLSFPKTPISRDLSIFAWVIITQSPIHSFRFGEEINGRRTCQKSLPSTDLLISPQLVSPGDCWTYQNCMFKFLPEKRVVGR